ncbi:Uncharacterised protein [Streptococcus dysgalactiae subsp. equisimilis]|nr:Uncharacterised protein [Streptococcus dysgalactiae subsp. equisimilis]
MNRSPALRPVASVRSHSIGGCRVLLGAVLLSLAAVAPLRAADGLVVVGYGGAGQKAQDVAFFQPSASRPGFPWCKASTTAKWPGSR